MKTAKIISLAIASGVVALKCALPANAQSVTAYTFDFGSAGAPLDAGTAQTPSSDFNGTSGLAFSLPLFDASSGQTLESVTATLTATVNGTVVAYNLTQSPISFQNAYTQVALALDVPGNSAVAFLPEATVSGSAQPFLPPAGTYTPSNFPITATVTSNPVVFGNINAFEAAGGGTVLFNLLSNGGSIGGPTIDNMAFGTNSDITIFGSVTIDYTSVPTAIPETPTYAAVLAAGALAFAMVRRRHRANSELAVTGVRI
jgi:hypothetical protein